MPRRGRRRRRRRHGDAALLPAQRRRSAHRISARRAQPVAFEVVLALGMASSKSDARRLIEQGGVKLNDRPVAGPTARVTAADFDAGGTIRLSVGKKRHGLIRRSDE